MKSLAQTNPKGQRTIITCDESCQRCLNKLPDVDRGHFFLLAESRVIVPLTGAPNEVQHTQKPAR